MVGKTKNITVTVLVPIFNAYEDTSKCLQSIAEFTDYRHQVLLVDDASTDPRISQLTKQFSLHRPNTLAIQNPQNLGFVKTCNRGMKVTPTQDIVLLNSDTVVTRSWLEKLIDAAYSSSSIATVTPLTNNGTICSVPNWLEFNEIPPDHTIESFADLIERISLRRYPKIPTAVGFCMYIKRSILDKIGYFDEINFYKGYGEENDFCCRALEAGYSHVLDDTTFIYHSGSKSFGIEKQKLIEKNDKVLAKLHPNYFPSVHAFFRDNLIQDILENIQIHLKLEDIKKRSPVCFFLHNSVDSPVNTPLAGTEYHCAALIREISDTQPVYLLYRNLIENSIVLEVFYQDQKLSFDFPCQIPYGHLFLHQDNHFLNLILEILNCFKPSLVHIHHLINLPALDITAALKGLQIPYLVSLHDYYLICPSYNLVDSSKSFCFEYKTPEYCKTCIQSLFWEGKELKAHWSNLCQELLAGATTIVAPSETAASYFMREYPQYKEKFKVIRHGIADQFHESSVYQTQASYEMLAETKEVVNPTSSFSIKVAFVGHITVFKGAEVVVRLLEKVWQQPGLRDCFSFEIMGRFYSLVPKEIKNVKVHSEYEQQELASALQSVDLVIFPAIWAETYCLTADEVLAAGIPILTTPLGAVAERVKEFGVGWASQSCDADALLDVLITIKNNPAELTKVRGNIKKYPLVSYEAMAKQYVAEYSKLASHHRDEQSQQLQATLSPQMVFAAYQRSINKPMTTPTPQRVPLSIKSKYLHTLKQQFPGIWEFFRRSAIKVGLVK
jgi:GT2 family glycosyltransferase